jgi:hypothetical protein
VLPKGVVVRIGAGVGHASTGAALLTTSDADPVSGCDSELFVYETAIRCVPAVSEDVVTEADPFTAVAVPITAPSDVKLAVPPENGCPSLPVITAIKVSV